MQFLITQRGRQRLNKLGRDMELGDPALRIHVSATGFIEYHLLKYVDENEPLDEMDLDYFLQDFEGYTTGLKGSTYKQIILDGKVSLVDGR